MYAAVHRIVLGLLLLLMAGVVFAQVVSPPDIGDLDPDFRAWFSSPAALAVTVGVFTAYARTLFKLQGNAVRITGLVLGVVLAGIGAAVNALERDLLTVLLFGLTAGVSAGGGWDILTGLITIVAKVFGVVLPGGLPSVEPVAVVPTRTVVIEKEPPKEEDL